jgi:glycosyltransferase involved in cell wall biosynthesis
VSSIQISVITATFNALPWLQRAIDSMLAQTCGQWEMLICPDHGQDYRWMSEIDPRLRIVSTLNHHTGAGAARNRGLEDPTSRLDFIQQMAARHTVLAPSETTVALRIVYM